MLKPYYSGTMDMSSVELRYNKTGCKGPLTSINNI